MATSAIFFNLLLIYYKIFTNSGGAEEVSYKRKNMKDLAIIKLCIIFSAFKR